MRGRQLFLRSVAIEGSTNYRNHPLREHSVIGGGSTTARARPPSAHAAPAGNRRRTWRVRVVPPWGTGARRALGTLGGPLLTRYALERLLYRLAVVAA